MPAFFCEKYAGGLRIVTQKRNRDFVLSVRWGEIGSESNRIRGGGLRLSGTYKSVRKTIDILRRALNERDMWVFTVWSESESRRAVST